MKGEGGRGTGEGSCGGEREAKLVGRQVWSDIFFFVKPLLGQSWQGLGHHPVVWFSSLFCSHRAPCLIEGSLGTPTDRPGQSGPVREEWVPVCCPTLLWLPWASVLSAQDSAQHSVADSHQPPYFTDEETEARDAQPCKEWMAGLQTPSSSCCPGNTATLQALTTPRS